jgi:hypothetical protein
VAQDREGKVVVAARLPVSLVELLDHVAQLDADQGFVPSRARTLTRVLPEALEALAEKRRAERAR